MSLVDVVIPVFRGQALTVRCIESVLTHGAERVGQLIAINDASDEPGLRDAVRALWRKHRQIRLLENERNLGFTMTANRGLLLRRRDVVVLNSDAEVTAGWLDGLEAATRALPRVAAAVPLSNTGGLRSVPVLDEATSADALRDRDLALGELPPATEMPTAMGFCLWMADAVLKEIGVFDPIYGRGYNEENDWCQRARARGYAVVRANRALVFHHGGASFGSERVALERRNARILWSRFPQFLAENERFRRTTEARLAGEHVQKRLHGVW